MSQLSPGAPHHDAYNAVVTFLRRAHEALLILRVRPDFGRLAFEPGQYTLLGLRSDAPSVASCPAPAVAAAAQASPLVRRAYSLSHTPLDEQGNVVRVAERDELEFYIALVRPAAPQRVPLTPRLFALEVGGRLYVGPRAHGTYTLQLLPPECDVLFCATGTGEAPHNAMIAELLARGHRGRIASLVCTRFRRDLAYRDEHMRLARRYNNYVYLPMTTREPENLDRSATGYVGKCYLQDVVTRADLAERIGFALDPARTHVFLCGHPGMIGLLPLKTPEAKQGLIELLAQRGFQADGPRVPGNIHYERFF